jgi:hypothetical protein
MDNLHTIPIWFFVGLFDTKGVDELSELSLERSCIEGNGDFPLWMLGMQVGRLECQHDSLARACQATDALHTFDRFDNSTSLEVVEIRDGIYNVPRKLDRSLR